MKQHAKIDVCSTFSLFLVKSLQYPLNSFMTVHNVLINSVTHGQYISTSCKVLHVLLKAVIYSSERLFTLSSYRWSADASHPLPKPGPIRKRPAVTANHVGTRVGKIFLKIFFIK